MVRASLIFLGLVALTFGLLTLPYNLSKEPEQRMLTFPTNLDCFSTPFSLFFFFLSVRLTLADTLFPLGILSS